VRWWSAIAVADDDDLHPNLRERESIIGNKIEVKEIEKLINNGKHEVSSLCANLDLPIYLCHVFWEFCAIKWIIVIELVFIY
jgi:hypothetical protein